MTPSVVKPKHERDKPEVSYVHNWYSDESDEASTLRADGWRWQSSERRGAFFVQWWARQPRGPLGRYRRKQWRIVILPIAT